MEKRLETYAIPGERKSGEITLNGPAARRVAQRRHYYYHRLCKYGLRRSKKLSAFISVSR